MKYVVEMGLGAMKYIKIGSAIQMLIGGTPRHEDRIEIA
jgi:hypothetical protein